MEEISIQISVYNDKDLIEYFNTENLEVLHKLKLYLDDLYYNTVFEPQLSDWQYDILKEILVKRDPSYIPPIGTKIRKNDNSVKLPYWLGSMNKLKPEDENEFSRWIEKYKSDSYIIEDKLDGISCLLVIINSKIKLYTRGDGVIGSDISYLAPYIQNIPKFSRDINLAIRGELIIKKITFENKYSDIFANPRNFVTGKIGSKTLKK